MREQGAQRHRRKITTWRRWPPVQGGWWWGPLNNGGDDKLASCRQWQQTHNGCLTRVWRNGRGARAFHGTSQLPSGPMAATQAAAAVEQPARQLDELRAVGAPTQDKLLLAACSRRMKADSLYAALCAPKTYTTADARTKHMRQSAVVVVVGLVGSVAVVAGECGPHGWCVWRTPPASYNLWPLKL